MCSCGDKKLVSSHEGLKWTLPCADAKYKPETLETYIYVRGVIPPNRYCPQMISYFMACISNAILSNCNDNLNDAEAVGIHFNA